LAVELRQLGPDDWEAFRTLRLHALESEPGVFLSSYAREAAFPDSDWRTRLGGRDRAMFGLFDGDAIVGLAGVIMDWNDPRAATAVLVASYLLPGYRRRGLSVRFYEARLAWVQAQPGVTRVVVSHRASNDASRRAIQRHGFCETARTSRQWHDGITEDEVVYELPIERGT
jgi:RimJ/RimL family protein N-acetyltransferase